MRTLNDQIEKVRELVRKAYGAVANKGGNIPDVGDRTLENLPSAITSILAANVEKAMRLNRGEELGDNILLIDYDGTILFAIRFIA